MVIKQTEIVEISPDLWEIKKKKSLSLTTSTEEEAESGTPLRGIFCLKTRQDMKVIEEKEDCFILDFDPNDAFDATKIGTPKDDDNDVAILHEKGQVACRDYPHPRHLCSKFPFQTTHHATHCDQCYCYVCDLVAPCAQWTSGYSPHCEALDNTKWKTLRTLNCSLHVTTNK